MGVVVPKPLGRFRQYRKSIGLEVQDPDRLLVEDLAGGREEVIGRFGAVVVDVSIPAFYPETQKAKHEAFSSKLELFLIAQRCFCNK